jgi:hypothetical protein
MPDYLAGLSGVTIGGDCPGVLQRVNPQATRTSIGCPNRCGFCAIGKGLIEAGGFRELTDWPDGPVLVDNNLFAASVEHFDRVMDRLDPWGWCDFNQGVDARRLTEHHAERIGRIPGAMVRLALDAMAVADAWEEAFRKLRASGVALRRIRSYALVGFTTGPEEAWERCEWIEGHGVKSLPMWFHELDALEWNQITEKQRALGWTDEERKALFQWYYKHRGAKPAHLEAA